MDSSNSDNYSATHPTITSIHPKIEKTSNHPTWNGGFGHVLFLKLTDVSHLGLQKIDTKWVELRIRNPHPHPIFPDIAGVLYPKYQYSCWFPSFLTTANLEKVETWEFLFQEITCSGSSITFLMCLSFPSCPTTQKMGQPRALEARESSDQVICLQCWEVQAQLSSADLDDAVCINIYI